MIPLHKFEIVNDQTSRLRVESGWLYMGTTGMAFVPDPVDTDFRHKLTKKQVKARRANVEKAREALAETRSKSAKVNKARR